MKKFRTAAIALLVIVAGAVAVFLGTGWPVSTRSTPPTTHAALFKTPRALPVFELPSTSGNAFDNKTLTGHWSLLYFGYTHCPDICPTTLALLAHVLGDLHGLAPEQQPVVYFISVDPERDDLAQMSTYVSSFGAGFIGVSGPVPELRKLTGRLGVAFSHSPPGPDGGYKVNHTAGIFLIGPHGHEVAVFTPPLDRQQMVSDYRKIVAYVEPSA